MINIETLTPYERVILIRALERTNAKQLSDVVPLLLQAIEARDGVLEELRHLNLLQPLVQKIHRAMDIP